MLTAREPLGEYPIEQRTDTRHVLLLDLHVDVDEPQIEPFWVTVHDTLKDRATALGVAKLELELGELGDRLDVCLWSGSQTRGWRKRVNGTARFRFSRLFRLRGRSSRASAARPRVR